MRTMLSLSSNVARAGVMGWKATLGGQKPESGSLRIATFFHVSQRQSLTVPSLDFEANRRPSKEKEMLLTLPVWPSMVISLSVSTSHKLIPPPGSPEASIRSSGDQAML